MEAEHLRGEQSTPSTFPHLAQSCAGAPQHHTLLVSEYITLSTTPLAGCSHNHIFLPEEFDTIIL